MNDVDFSCSFEIEMSGSLPMLVYLEKCMPEDIEEAWQITLRKWEILSTQADRVEGDEILHDGGVSTCGLCLMFHGYVSRGEAVCGDCPIAKAGHPECWDTPYRDYRGAKSVEDAQLFAKEELRFLKQIKKGLEVKDE